MGDVTARASRQDMFSIRATRRSAAASRRDDRTERVHLLGVDPSPDLTPGGYYAELGFRPPID